MSDFTPAYKSIADLWKLIYMLDIKCCAMRRKNWIDFMKEHYDRRCLLGLPAVAPRFNCHMGLRLLLRKLEIIDSMRLRGHPRRGPLR